MKYPNFTLKLFLFALLIPFNGFSQVTISDIWDHQFIEQDCQILPMKSENEYISDHVINGIHDYNFQKFDSKFIIGKESYNWLKLNLVNNSTKNHTFYLGTTQFENISFWIKTDSLLVGPIISGQSIPFDQKPVQIKGLSFFKFDIPQHKKASLFLKVSNKNGSVLPEQVIPLVIANEKYFQSNFEKPGEFSYIFLGAVGIMFIFNLLLFFTTRIRAYFYYAGFVVFIVIFALGLVPQFAYSLYGNMNINGFPIGTAGTISAIFYILVGVEIMEIKKYYPKVFKFLMAIIILYVVALFALYFNFTTIGSIINFANAFCLFLTLFVIAFLMLFKKHVPSKFYFFAILIYIIGVMILLLSLTKVLPSVMFGLPSISYYQIALVAEMALFSLGISVRINQMKLLQTQEKFERLRADQMISEKEQTRKLLLNTLPETTVDELMQNGKVKPRLYKNTTILFMDIVGFTNHVEKLSPENLIAELDYYYKKFDEIVEKYKIEKIKTIGDAYLAISGLPNENETHAKDVVRAAQEIFVFMNNEKEIHSSQNKDSFQIRIGIHSGSVIAGLVGITKFAYDIWGDTVNIAARMEQSGYPGKINISEATYEIIKDEFECEYRGKIEAKNKGKIDMYFVLK